MIAADPLSTDPASNGTRISLSCWYLMIYIEMASFAILWVRCKPKEQRRPRMAHRIRDLLAEQVQVGLQELVQAEGLPFRDLLSPDRVVAALARAGLTFRERIYTPVITLWAFLSQVLSQRGACQQAVARVLAHRLEAGLVPCSVETTSYCEARQRLSETVISGLTTDIGMELHDQAAACWKMNGRDVVIVDGSTARMADTRANQQVYPQSRNQQAGVGSPLLRFVVLLSLSVGTVLGCAIGACRGKKTGEQSLFRQLRGKLKRGSILLADCLYDCYHDIAELQAQGVDVVFGMKQSRKHDFRCGRRLGCDDHVVTWQKPKYDRSRFTSREQWASLPDSLEIREARLRVTRKGYRSRVIIVVTTLVDAAVFTQHDLMELFRQRWHCELDLRSIKSVLGMKELKCETPEMVRKELWIHLLAYNLIRVRMAQAALLYDVQPRHVSFQSALTFHQEFESILQRATVEEKDRMEREMLRAIAHCLVGDRPGRKEPRLVKKREQKYKYLTKPRAEARKGLPA
jgi:hypothetical protein